MEFHEGVVALVAVTETEEVPGDVPFSPSFIVLEDEVVMSHHLWSDTLINLFGLMYLSYLGKCTCLIRVCSNGPVKV